MRALYTFFATFLFSASFAVVLNAGTSPCSATNYQLSDFGITKTYNLDNGTYEDLPDPSCGDYQGQDFWVTFTGPSSGLVNLELIEGSITDAAFEVYWNACNGLATSVGCFADRNCGSEPMPGANIEVIPGETYHIRIFQEGGGTGSIGFRMSDLGGTEFSLAGTAQEFNSGVPNQNCIQLTTENNNQVGCAWFETPVDFASGFEINYQLYFGTIDAGGADGIAFIFHTDPSPPCSSAGGQLGFVGIPNSFIVEFDTWTNGNYGDNIPDDHVAINLDGFIDIPIAAPVSIGTNGNVEDGAWHDVTLRWDPATDIFEVVFDGDLKIAVDIGLITDIFVAGTPVYWGVTGSTGGAFNDQIFCFDGFEVVNTNSVQTNIDAKICAGQPYIFGNSILINEEGEFVEVFPAANGCDSTVTLNLELVDIDILGITEVELPCDDDASVVQLAAIVNSNVDENLLDYEWSTDDGTIEMDGNTLTPIVSSVGTYTLTIESNPEDCQAVFSVEVSIAEAPFVQAEGGYTSCDEEITLSCNGDPNVTVEWTTEDGNIIGDPNIPNPTVDTAGTYTVTVTDINTGCTSQASTTVLSGGEADSGPDLFYCVGEDGSVFLQGSVSGNVVGFEWSPATGLEDPNDLNPRVLDLVGEMSYSLVVCNKVGQNLIDNGDFSEGDSSFSTDYIKDRGGPGGYLVTNDPSSLLNAFESCEDFSQNDDLMLTVDTDSAPNQNFWCQSVEVEEGTEYILSAWFTNVFLNPNAIPDIAFLVNGNQVNANVSSIVDWATCEWDQLESNIFMATTSNIEVCFTNTNLNSNGNDFAIDDIELFQVCKLDGGICRVSPYDEIDLTIEPAEIACQENQILELNASSIGVGLTDISWSWEVFDQNGIYLANTDSSNPTVQGPGTYYVTLNDNLTGCFTRDSIVLVEGNPEFPQFDLSADLLNCLALEQDVIVTNLDPNFTYDFNWDGDNSDFTIDGDTAIIISAAGEYMVTVTNTQNNCQTVESIEVGENVLDPQVEIDPLPLLTCKDIGEVINLVGMASGSGDISYEWYDADGMLLSETFTLETTDAGTYTLIVLDAENGCDNTTSIEVDFEETDPEANISAAVMINCQNEIAELVVSSPPGSDYSYNWTTDIGGFNSDQDINVVQANGAGEYEVIVTDNLTGCTTILSTSVSADFTPPQYTVNDPPLLDCANNQVGVSIDGDNLSFAWAMNDNIISALDANTVTVISEGDYEVIITNTESGCTEIQNIEVDADLGEPDVEAGNPLTFGCSDMSLDLEGSSNTVGVLLDWQTAGGVILDGQDSFSPSIGGAGTYYLTVTGSNGCTSRDSVVVNADTDLPTIDAPENLILNCNNPAVIIDATGSSNGSNFTFEWTDQDGNAISDFNTLDPTVNGAGQYQLTILNTLNDCNAFTIVNVIEDFEEPTANITPVADLSCDAITSTFGLELSNPDWTYSWSDQNGQLVDENSFQISTGTEGGYTLSILNQQNGCTNSYDFQLNDIGTEPTLVFAGPTEISCLESQITISASTDATDPIFSWASDDGNIISTTDLQEIQLNSPGNYAITITDALTGCEAEDVLVVSGNSDMPVITIQDPSQITCEDTEVMIIATVVNIGTDVSYIWSTDNGLINSPNGGPNVTAGSEGAYTLTVINNENGCEAVAFIDVLESVSNFIVDISTPVDLDCNTTEQTLNVEEVDGASITYTWSTLDGNIVSDENTSNPIINQAGQYTVLITDQSNGCTAEGNVTITQDENVPVINVIQPVEINCYNDVTNIDAMGSSEGSDFTIIWTTTNGMILSGANSLNPEIDGPGTYNLSIQNTTNNCSIDQDIIITENIAPPEIELAPFDDVSCDNPNVLVTANVLDGNENLEFVWSNGNGLVNPSIDGQSIETNEIGDYELLVTNPVNGCVSSIVFAISGDSNVPDISITPPDIITCVSNVNSLDAIGSSEGVDFLVVWSSLDGTIINGENSLTPEISGAGTYTLSIEDLGNNCSVTQEVVVEENIEAPEVEILPFDDLTCDNPSVIITADIVSAGDDFTFSWSTDNGSVIGLTDGQSIEAAGLGNYNLLVTNQDNGCIQNLGFYVNGNQNLPQVSIIPPNNIDCVNTNVSIALDLPTDASDLSFNWATIDGEISGPSNEADLSVISEGAYSVTITNTQSNCEVILNTQVDDLTEEPNLDFIEPEMITCSVPRAVINTQTTTNGLIYSWTTLDGEITSALNGEDAVVSTSGTYTLTVTNPANNCQNSIDVEVFEDIELPIVDIQPALELTCLIMEQNLSADGSSFGSEFIYEWTSQNGQVVSDGDTPFPLINEPGYYVLEILNTVNNCKQIDSILITENTLQPLASLATPEDLSCMDTTVVLSSDLSDTNNLTIEWTTLIGNIITDPNQTSIEVDQPGVYELQITNNANGCENLLSTTVEQNISAPPLMINPGFTLTCDNTEGTLSITESDPSSELSWLGPDQNFLQSGLNLSVSEPGIYTAVSTYTESGCQSSLTVEVIENDNVPTDIVTDVAPPLCFGETGSITIIEVTGGEGPYLYSTDGGQSFGDLTMLEDLSAGSTSEIIAQDINGCQVPIEIVMPGLIDLQADLPTLIELDFGEDYQIQVQTNIPDTDIETIIWTPSAGLSCTDCLNPTVSPQNNINYEVEIVTTNGCTEFAAIQLRVDRDIKVYIPNAFSPYNGDGVNDSFYVFAKESVVTNVQVLHIYDRWGNELFINENFNPNDASAGWNGRYRSEKMQPGVYVYYTIVEYVDGSTELFKGDFTLID